MSSLPYSLRYRSPLSQVDVRFIEALLDQPRTASELGRRFGYSHQVPQHLAESVAHMPTFIAGAILGRMRKRGLTTKVAGRRWTYTERAVLLLFSWYQDQDHDRGL